MAPAKASTPVYDSDRIAIDACLLNPMAYCSLQYIGVYIFECLELNAVPRYAGLAEFLSICLGEVFLIFDTEDVDRDPVLFALMPI